MEHQTQFDLNKAIASWRDRLSPAEGISAVSLDELEVHLRDSIEALELKGLSPEESFLIARRRLGSGEVLALEYGKPNVALIWSRRAFWMVVGVFTCEVMGKLANGIAFASMGVGLSIGLAGFQTMIVALMVSLLVPGILAAAIWRVVTRWRSRAGRLEMWFRSRPVALWLLAFVAVPLSTGCYAMLFRYGIGSQLGVEAIAKIMRWQTLVTLFVSMLLWPSLLLWLLHRTKKLDRETQ